MMNYIPTPYETNNNPATAYLRAYGQPAPYIGPGFSDYYSNYAAMVAVGQAEQAALSAGTQLSYEQRLSIAANAGIAYRRNNGIDLSAPLTREQIERSYRTPVQPNVSQPLDNAAAIASRVPGNIDPYLMRTAISEGYVPRMALPSNSVRPQPQTIEVLDLNKAINQYGGTIIGDNGKYSVYQGPSAMRGSTYIPPGQSNTLDLTKGEYFPLSSPSQAEVAAKSVLTAPADIFGALGQNVPQMSLALKTGNIVGLVGLGVQSLDITGRAVGNALEGLRGVSDIAAKSLPAGNARTGFELGYSTLITGAEIGPFVLSLPAMAKSAIENPHGVPSAAIGSGIGMARSIGLEAVTNPGTLPGNIAGMYLGGKLFGGITTPLIEHSIERVAPYVPAGSIPIRFDPMVSVGGNSYSTVFFRSNGAFRPVAGIAYGSDIGFKAYAGSPYESMRGAPFQVNDLFNVRNPGVTPTPAQLRLYSDFFARATEGTPENLMVTSVFALKNTIPLSEAKIPQMPTQRLGETPIANVAEPVHSGLVDIIASQPGHKIVGSLTLSDIVGKDYMRDVSKSDIDPSVPSNALNNIMKQQIRDTIAQNPESLVLRGYEVGFKNIDQDHIMSVMAQGPGRAEDVRTFSMETTLGKMANAQTTEYSMESKLSRLFGPGSELSYSPERGVTLKLGGTKPNKDLADIAAAAEHAAYRAYSNNAIGLGETYESIASRITRYSELSGLDLGRKSKFESVNFKFAKIGAIWEQIRKEGRMYSGIPVGDEYGDITVSKVGGVGTKDKYSTALGGIATGVSTTGRQPVGYYDVRTVIEPGKSGYPRPGAYPYAMGDIRSSRGLYPRGVGDIDRSIEMAGQYPRSRKDEVYPSWVAPDKLQKTYPQEVPLTQIYPSGVSIPKTTPTVYPPEITTTRGTYNYPPGGIPDTNTYNISLPLITPQPTNLPIPTPGRTPITFPGFGIIIPPPTNPPGITFKQDYKPSKSRIKFRFERFHPFKEFYHVGSFEVRARIPKSAEIRGSLSSGGISGLSGLRRMKRIRI